MYISYRTRKSDTWNIVETFRVHAWDCQYNLELPITKIQRSSAANLTPLSGPVWAATHSLVHLLLLHSPSNLNTRHRLTRALGILPQPPSLLRRDSGRSQASKSFNWKSEQVQISYFRFLEKVCCFLDSKVKILITFVVDIKAQSPSLSKIISLETLSLKKRPSSLPAPKQHTWTSEELQKFIFRPSDLMIPPKVLISYLKLDNEAFQANLILKLVNTLEVRVFSRI